tara:strand:+ start:442 stop:1416 length:975 start_codon:yes stop_codon:yes gene_type:complete
MKLGTTSLSVTQLGSSGSVSGVPAGPVYTLTAPNNVDEGNSLQCNVTCNQLAGDGTLYWDINHVTTNAADFSFQNDSGTVTVNNQVGTFFIAAAADNTTEGPETFDINLRTGSASGPLVAQVLNVTINDTSITPVTSYYHWHSHTKGVSIRPVHLMIRTSLNSTWTSVMTHNQNSNNWISRSYNLQNYAGQNVKIGHAVQRSSQSSSTYWSNDCAIDDMHLVVAGNTIDLRPTNSNSTNQSRWKTNANYCHSSAASACSNATNNIFVGSSYQYWNANTGPTGSSGTGPNSAYVGTHFFYFEASSMNSSCNYDWAAVVFKNFQAV